MVALNDPTKLRLRVAARIAELRAARGWTQEQLAEKIEASSRYAQALEGGRQNLTLDSLAKVGNVLQVRVEELFTQAAPRRASARRKKQ